jgi:hypothetical protein
MKKSLILIFLLLLAACTANPATQEAGEIATLPPTTSQLQGNVDIVYPISGSIIYTEALWLEGTAENVPTDGFMIQVIAPDDTVLAQSIVVPQDGQWQIEIPHNYNGDPSEATIIAKSIDTSIAGDYDIVSIVISGAENRPEGIFGSLLVPNEGDTVGGDTIYVSGRGSGFFENTFTVVLETADDAEQISSVIVTMHNPYFMDDMVWEAEIPRNDFVGNGVIRGYYTSAETGEEIEVFRVNVVVSSVAG